MSAGSFTITPSGPFSLAEAASFGFGQRDAADWDGVMRLAFCLDGCQEHVGAEVRQDDAGDVHAAIHGPANIDVGSVRRQVARVLSLDHDGAEFMLVGERDPVIGKLQAAAPGLRPPLFYSPCSNRHRAQYHLDRPAFHETGPAWRPPADQGVARTAAAVRDLAARHRYVSDRSPHANSHRLTCHYWFRLRSRLRSRLCSRMCSRLC